METRIKVTDISLERIGDKYWIRVYFDNDTSWIPKLTECAKIFSGIGKAETKKYPNGKGWLLVKEFMDECWNKTKAEIDAIYPRYDPNGVTKESKAENAGLNRITDKGWNA